MSSSWSVDASSSKSLYETAHIRRHGATVFLRLHLALDQHHHLPIELSACVDWNLLLMEHTERHDGVLIWAGKTTYFSVVFVSSWSCIFIPGPVRYSSPHTVPGSSVPQVRSCASDRATKLRYASSHCASYLMST